MNASSVSSVVREDLVTPVNLKMSSQSGKIHQSFVLNLSSTTMHHNVRVFDLQLSNDKPGFCSLAGSSVNASKTNTASNTKTLLTNALAKVARNSPNKTVNVGKKNTPSKAAAMPKVEASSKNTPNKAKGASNKSNTPGKAGRSGKVAVAEAKEKDPEIIDIDLSDGEEELEVKTKKPSTLLPKSGAGTSQNATLAIPKPTAGNPKSTNLNTTQVKSSQASSLHQSKLPDFRKSFKKNEELVSSPRVKEESILGGVRKPSGATDGAALTALREEVELWKAKFEKANKCLQEKEQTIKQLDVKIPNMINEFQKCIENKDNLMGLSEKKVKEVSSELEEKRRQLEDSSGKLKEFHKKMTTLGKEKEEVTAINSKLKNDLIKKDNEANKVSKENGMKIKSLQEELNVKKNECAAQIKSLIEMEKLKLEAATKESKMIKVEKENEKIKENVALLKKDYESRLNEVKELRRQEYVKINEELEKVKKENYRITFLEADLKLNVDQRVEMEAAVTKAKEKIKNLETNSMQTVNLLKQREMELQSAAKLQYTPPPKYYYGTIW